jgi:NDP-sugar pyrophosphorylase family protein
MRTVVVLAGGLGTRVAHLLEVGQPKALLPVGGHPFIDVKLAQLRSAGAQRAVVLTGYGARVLEDHLRTVSIQDLELTWSNDGMGLRGTGGAIVAIRESLPERFWITYGDTLVDAPMSKIEAALGDDMLGVMTVLHNQDRWAPSNVAIEGTLVIRYEKGMPKGTMEWIDYGLLYLRRSVLDQFSVDMLDLETIMRFAVDRQSLGAFPVHERFFDVGTEEAWRETDEWARRTHLCERLGLEG